MHKGRILTSWPIRKKLLLLILVIFLPASGIMVASDLDFRGHEISEAKDSALLLAQSLAAQQEQIAIGTKQMLSTLAQLSEVQSLDAKACNELFRQLHDRHPFYSTLAATTPDGNMFAGSPPVESGTVNLSDRKHIKDAIRALDFSAGEYIVGRVSKVQSINYTYPVVDASQNLVAVVIAGFKLDEYTRFMKKTNLPEGSSLTITDHAGVRLYRLPEHDATAPGKPIPKDAMERISGEAEQGIYERMGQDGIERIYAFKQLRLREDLPPYLYMIVGIPKDKIVLRASLEMLSNLSILGLAAVMAMALAWGFGNFVFIKPINHLVTATQRFGKGEMGARTELPHTLDELGQLAKSFDDMASLLEMRNLERKSANDALRESEAKYRTLIETTDTGYVIIDREGKVLDANAEYVRLTGHGALQEIVGREVVEWTAAYDRDRNAQEIMQCAEKGFTRNLELDYVNRKGEVTPVETNANLIRTGEGTVILALCRDITERKRAEDELQKARDGLEIKVAERTAELARANETLKMEIIERKQAEVALTAERQRLFSVLESLPATVYLQAPDNSFRYANRTFVENFGEPEGKHCYEIFKQLDAPCAECGTRRIFEAREFQEKESTNLFNGHSYHIFKYPFTDTDGSPLMLGLGMDITERKRAEDALRESEKRYRDLASLLPQPVLEISESMIVTFANQATLDACGYAQEELEKGFHTLQLLAPEDRERAVRDFVNRLEGRGNTYNEYTALRKDGTTFPVGVYSSVVMYADKPVGIRVVAIDLTEHKRSEEELKLAKNAAEAASRAKSEFLANMSHEIRTPMNGVIGMLELVLRMELTSQQKEFLAIACDSADSLLRLLNDIIDFSKIEAGRLELDHIAFSLRETLGDAIKYLAVPAHIKGIELAHRIAPETPDMLVGDPGRIKQILTNLVGNAIKFTEKGEVVIKVEVESEGEDEIRLHFAVKDTGIGVPREKQKLIFGAFTQADSSTTRQFGGSGLGLTICSRLVGLMGGKIWVESEKEEGSTFHFTAGLGKSTSMVSPAGLADIENLKGMPVLMVDDNATTLHILSEILTQWHMKSTKAMGGKAAVAELEKAAGLGKPYPLVLLDLWMPDMDGFAVAEQIKQNSRLAEATIVMLSSIDSVDCISRCKELGIRAYLRKPIKHSELLIAIVQALGIKTARRSEAFGLPHPALPKARRKLRILLAEDNPVNQRVAVAILEERGHQMGVAESGREALELFQRESFDVILMDVQMPEMDGFETTAAIREMERLTGGHVPIIAMTAYALKGDEARCLSAGMDDYLSKPIQPERFIRMVETTGMSSEVIRAESLPREPGRLSGKLGSEPEKDQEPHTAKDMELLSEKVFDPDKALEGVGGKMDLLREIITIFSDQAAGLLAEIRRSIEDCDCQDLSRAAHTLKGSVGSFGAQEASDAALKMEEIGREGSFTDAEAFYDELERKIMNLSRTLVAFKEKRAY